jgi:hypothetical protein
MALARYYFDIQDGAQVMQDDEGAEFDSLDAAVQGRPARRLRLERAGWRRAIPAMSSSR